MNKKKKLFIAFGTRPEAIKMAPLVRQFKLHNDKFDTIVCVTAQHREMLDQVLKIFEIIPDYDLDLMEKGQSLTDLTSNIIRSINTVLTMEKPDLVFVQGDTTTTFAVSLVAYYLHIPVAHIEAGLRTNDKYSPFPEEINRRLTSVVADYHYAPTQCSKDNLLKEGISNNVIFITGNTVIDALLFITKRNQNKSKHEKWSQYFYSNYNIKLTNDRIIVITGHRRESFGRGFENICQSLAVIANKNPKVKIIYPVHLNPNIQGPVYSILGNIDNIYLIPPLDYLSFIFLMERSYIILTDSGGIQEEAPSLGKPVLVMRNTTERPEGIMAGTAKLVGTEINSITSAVLKLLNDKNEYVKMAKAINPYGDGLAAERIIESLYKLNICST